MKKILLVDGNNNAWRAFHKYKGLRHGKNHVSMVFGLPSIINGLIKKFNPNKTIIVWDGSKSKHRLSIHPEYKAKRKLNPDFEDFCKQKDFVTELFFLMGIPQVKHEGMEADDYIYMLSRIYKKKGYHVTIISADKDFKQLISKNLDVWDGSKQILQTYKNLKSIFGYKANQVVDLLTLLGDDSDNIPGYRGMGEKRCADFFEKFGSIKNYLESNEEYRFINKDTLLELVKKNTLLIDLKFFYKTFLRGKVKPVYYKGKKNPKFNKEAFLKVCRKLKIKTFQQKSFLKNYE